MKIPVNLLKRSRVPALCIILVVSTLCIAWFNNQSKFANYFFTQPLAWCAFVILIIVILVNVDDYIHERQHR
ncbi:hypothetical protein GS399_07125 [Pedobacter sp. HMF7647]|uniref:Uncharacterized protein n=1 Tax=Hufsiella arboris TaxID=2695275 RepID=A0A7K1Y8J3_9SPHI|nr:hypothetical protein [Hufsiella arboris]MXV50740.1 hypothetical protein [Hufsiella arboris]